MEENIDITWRIKLESIAQEVYSLQQISDVLKQIRDSGITKEQVIQHLEILRSNSLADDYESKILEILDIAEGFCNTKYKVW